METPAPPIRSLRVWPVALALLLSGVAIWYASISPSVLLYEEQSEFSRIRVRAKGSVRTLLFVRDNGQEVVESRIDLQAPHKLLLSYSRAMFASHFFQPDPQRVLIVGLGGGSMVKFLHAQQPTVKIDAVEIDPVIVRLADELFGTRSSENVQIITADALDYLADTEHTYDVIYMDAFLKPSVDTDGAGIPQRLKTIDFYKSVQEQLSARGVVVFNLSMHDKTESDIETIGTAFAHTWVFKCQTRNLIVVAQRVAEVVSNSQLHQRARALDQKLRADFSFEGILADLRRP